jgi:hypothetical protein
VTAWEQVKSVTAERTVHGEQSELVKVRAATFSSNVDIRAIPDRSPARATGTRVDFSSSREGIDISAGRAIWQVIEKVV